MTGKKWSLKHASKLVGWIIGQKSGIPGIRVVVPYINSFKDPNLGPDKRAIAAQIIKRELDRTLSDSLPIPTVKYGPMGRLRNRGIRCGRIGIRSNVRGRPIMGEVVYLKGQGFAVFGDVQSPRPLILEAGGESVIGDGLLGMMEAWQIRELAKKVFVEVAKMSAA